MAAFALSGWLDINCLRALGSILHLEFYRVSLSDGSKPFSLDVCVMYEYIISIIPFQKPKTLLLIKPFYFTFNHTKTSYNKKLLNITLTLNHDCLNQEMV